MTILEEIFENGYATKDVDLAEGKFKAIVKNLSTDEQLTIESALSNLKDKSNAYVLHQYSLQILQKTVLSLNGTAYTDEKLLRKALGKLPTAIVDSLIKAQNQFEKEIAKLINPNDVDKTFFETDSTQEGSGQASEALSSENKGA